ncbi:MAG TPA: hypothetical protein VEF54_00120 [archaeon]|nr:hypothetical protein [archaeon]
MANRILYVSAVLIAAVLYSPPARCQGRGSFSVVPSGQTATAAGMERGARIGFVPFRRSRRFYGGAGYWPYYSADYDGEGGMIEEPPPRTIVVQAAAPATTPPESLLLELRGDHWVRITSQGEAAAVEQPAAPLTAPRRIQDSTPAPQLPAAVLVFRDGHEEEIKKYTIVGSTIYTPADYWTTGSWTRKIPTAELDIPATLKLNRERGAKFSLPSGPNEVVFRP